jgi:hypothetical protein
VHPYRSTTDPGWVSAQLPPFSAARSTITEPFFMLRTISSVISTGAGLLGMRAVVTMMSTSLTGRRTSPSLP